MLEQDVDWSFIPEESYLAALQLIEPGSSRIVGLFVEEGQLFVGADLGFIFGRFSGPNRWMAQFIYLFKSWHQDAVHDGRVMLRVAGKRYERQLERVEEPKLLNRLRSRYEKIVQLAITHELPEAPTAGPRDIWFFRIVPRANAIN